MARYVKVLRENLVEQKFRSDITLKVIKIIYALQFLFWFNMMKYETPFFVKINNLLYSQTFKLDFKKKP